VKSKFGLIYYRIFLAERYEHKSVMITTNLVFSEWERIFKNLMTPWLPSIG
jgi:DNA replication protein DnaC